MPARKSWKRIRQAAAHGAVTPESLINVSANPAIANTSSKPPWKLSMFVPRKPVDDTGDDYIHSRLVSKDGAREIVEKYGNRVYIVGEQINSSIYRWGTPAIELPRLLIALNVVPVGGMVLSFSELSRIEKQIAELEELGAQVLCLGIEDAPTEEELAEIKAGNAEYPRTYIRNVVGDMMFQYEWTGCVPKEITDWINLRFYAMGVLNCCYVGRGAPTGVNLREQAEMMVADTELLNRFVQSISSGLRELPDMQNVRLEPWREKILWDNRFQSHYQKALKQSESFREFFYFAPMSTHFPDIAEADADFKTIKELMRQMIYAYEKGEENNIPDVIWTAEVPEQMADALDEIGIVSSIQAYLMGVPYEDIIA